MSGKLSKFYRVLAVFVIMIASIATVTDAREYYITPDGETVYYSPPPRIFYYESGSENDEIYITFVGHGEKPERIKEPAGIFIDRNDRVYISDAGAGAVKVYTNRGKFLRSIGEKNSGANALERPGPLALNSFGEIYVSDLSKREIFIYAYPGRFLNRMEASGKKEAQIDIPSSIAIKPDGGILFLDGEKSRVVGYSFKRRFESSWGEFGTDAGKLNHPRDLAVSRGEVFIADTQNHKVEVFDEKGRALRRFGGKGDTPGRFLHPHAITVDPRGKITVADNGGGRIQFFTAFGHFLGQMRFDQDKKATRKVRVRDMAFDSIGTLYLIDQRGRRVLKIPPQNLP